MVYDSLCGGGGDDGICQTMVIGVVEVGINSQKALYHSKYIGYGANAFSLHSNISSG